MTVEVYMHGYIKYLVRALLNIELDSIEFSSYTSVSELMLREEQYLVCVDIGISL